jgi:predicted nuclease of predicted toxin-antitoxin system
MKIKLDENVPSDLVSLLQALGHDVHSVYDEGLVGASDERIWEAAQRESRFFITQDLDFSDIRVFGPASHHGILLIRLSSPSRANLISRIVELFETQDLSGWIACFIVANERKLRVLKPPIR